MFKSSCKTKLIQKNENIDTLVRDIVATTFDKNLENSTKENRDHLVYSLEVLNYLNNNDERKTYFKNLCIKYNNKVGLEANIRPVNKSDIIETIVYNVKSNDFLLKHTNTNMLYSQHDYKTYVNYKQVVTNNLKDLYESSRGRLSFDKVIEKMRAQATELDSVKPSEVRKVVDSITNLEDI